MITGEYIIEFVGIDSKGMEIAKGNSFISDIKFNDAHDFYNEVINSIINDYPILSSVRIVGVFKL